jgi:hypothetical protein
MYRRSLSGVILGALFLVGSLNASEMIEITPFTAAHYTNSFTRGLDGNLEVKVSEAGQVKKARMTIQQFPGKPTKRFGSDWLGVTSAGIMISGEEKIDVRFLDLYDPKSLQIQHSIDLSDDSVSSYQWTKFPSSIRSGQKVKVGNLIQKDSSGKTLSSGDVEFILSKLSDGFEFCTIETMIGTKTKGKEINKECIRFDSSRRIIDASIWIKSGPDSITTGSGKISIK